MAVAIGALLMTFTLLTTSEALIYKHQEDHAINARSIKSVPQPQDVGLDIARRTDLQSLENKVVGLERQLASVKSTLQKRVAFSVHFSEGADNVNVQAAEPFKFDAVVTNIGNGYNPSSGMFTAPYSGVYIFILTVNMDNQHSWLYAVIDKSGEILCRAALNGAGVDVYDKSTCSSTTHMRAGDRVYVRRFTGGDTYLRGGMYCSFTGALISADIV